jgi:E3 SUMO-protein ligase RanBP2
MLFIFVNTEEIRRLERALSRIEVAKNLEYLKNLLVKFISLEPGSSEKQQLVPVLKEILKLDSKEEKVLLMTAASDSEVKAGQANGWSFLWS